MSRISTPNIPVNPNLGMVGLNAPAIQYRPQPTIQPNLVQYEQLTNILNAGVQAAGTFFEVERQAADLARRNRIQEFETGYSAAIKESTEVAANTGQYDDLPIRSFLSRYEYDNETDEIKERLNVAYTRLYGDDIERQQEMIKLQRQHNGKIMAFNFKTHADRVLNTFYDMDEADQAFLLEIRNEPEQLIKFVMGSVPDDVRQLYENLGDIDRNDLIQPWADEVNKMMSRLNDIQGKIRDRAQVQMLEPLGAVTGNAISRGFVFGQGYAGTPFPLDIKGSEAWLPTEYESHKAAFLGIKPDASPLDIRQSWTNSVRYALNDLISQRNPMLLDRMARAVENDPNILPAEAKTLINEAKSARDKIITDNITSMVEDSVQGKTRTGLDRAKGMLGIYAESGLFDDNSKLLAFERTIDNGYKTVQTTLQTEGATRVVDQAFTQPYLVSDREVENYVAVYEDNLKSRNEYVDYYGNVQRVLTPQQIAESSYSLGKAISQKNSSMTTLDESVQIEGIRLQAMERILEGGGPQEILSGITRAFPNADDQKRVTSQLNNWFYRDYLPAYAEAIKGQFGIDQLYSTPGSVDPDSEQRFRARAAILGAELLWETTSGVQTTTNNIRNRARSGINSSELNTAALEDVKIAYDTAMSNSLDPVKVLGGDAFAETLVRMVQSVNFGQFTSPQDLKNQLTLAGTVVRLSESGRPQLTATETATYAESMEKAMAEFPDLTPESAALVRFIYNQGWAKDQYATSETKATNALNHVRNKLASYENQVYPVAAPKTGWWIFGSDARFEAMKFGPLTMKVAAEALADVEGAYFVPVRQQAGGTWEYALYGPNRNPIALDRAVTDDKGNVVFPPGQRLFTAEQMEQREMVKIISERVVKAAKREAAVKIERAKSEARSVPYYLPKY
jgi:hypothetical protein